MSVLQEIVRPLLNWYDRNARSLPWRDRPEPYRVWVSEIMLQQTRVEAVKPYFARFMEELPTVAALAAAPEQQLMKLWEGLGYYSRARNLQRAAQVLVEQYDGKLPADYEELLRLPGIGPYTAGAVASIAFQIPAPAVDGNVLRVVMRLTASRDNISEPAVKRAVEEQIRQVIPQDRPGDFNQAMMELGATVCGPGGEPRCLVCPLAGLCEGNRLGVARELPVKAKKKARRIEEKTVFLLVYSGELAIRRREDSGLLAGLWELPSAEGRLSPEGAGEVLQDWGIHPLQLKPLPAAKHIFTHVEWHMTGYWVELEEKPNGFSWAGRGELLEVYALPSAFRAYLDAFTG
ncbi:A/G-specific adenine glycosylase [Clostridium sp. D33t1_170424_F3]|uniref:A/G-specific adenine glycosylase n=1 Tax=Clostridium sp. D33t1_170424_F3 TaxID=2787099 RepID=UPI0018A9DA81|nr:A/G-specific adenine glycosylase [Clostridium sp. D33t1_170424_F3]